MTKKNQRGSVRIIGGRWKRQIIRLIDSPHLRPTPDAVRETLFNWLAPIIDGTYCLDLFSGSGALGFEAASRGASRVDLVEQDSGTYKQLVETRDRLSASEVHVHFGDAMDFLTNTSHCFDIVFLDPPFEFLLNRQIFQTLQDLCLIKANGFVYFEAPKIGSPVHLPEDWHPIRTKLAGQIIYTLYEVKSKIE